jgi:hypothetical protein
MNNEWLEYAAVLGLFLAGMIPVVVGIRYLIKENRRLNEVEPPKKNYETPRLEEEVFHHW